MAPKRKQPRLKQNIRTKSLDPASNTRVRSELLDYDPEWLKWLKENHPDEYLYYAQFMDEWVGGAIEKTGTKKRKDGTTIYNSGKVAPGHIHNTQELAKDVMDRNNRRNNDVFGVSRANNLMSDVVSELDKNDGWYITQPKLTEDALISQIEEKQEDDSILSYKEYLKVKDQLTPEMLVFYMSIYELD